jgi:hypothetical protein
VTVDLLRVSPLAPAEQIRSGLSAVHTGITDSRARIEHLTRDRDDEIAVLVDVQHRLRAEAFAIARTRRGRHLQVGEREGARARERDGPPLLTKEPRVPRPSLPPPLPKAVKPANDVTTESLRIYGLLATPETRRSLDDREAWRRIMGR